MSTARERVVLAGGHAPRVRSDVGAVPPEGGSLLIGESLCALFPPDPLLVDHWLQNSPIDNWVIVLVQSVEVDAR